MDIQFFRSEPDAAISCPQQPIDPEQTPGVVLVFLERHNDPDAISHAGYDFYGAYGDRDQIDQWAEDQPLEAIDRDQMPAVMIWFPAPFSDPEA